MNKEIIRAINDLEEWAEEKQLDEMEIRRAVHQLLPSYKLTHDTSYGLYSKNGYHLNYFEIFKDGERYSVHFYEYNSYWDICSQSNIYSS